MNGRTRRAGIVGGGVGGLATAIALRQAGWQVTVFEQAPEFGRAGAGIVLPANGIAALDALGLGERIREHQVPDRSSQIRTSTGRTLMNFQLSDAMGYQGMILLARSDLIALLVDALPSECIHTDATVRAVRENGVVETDSRTAEFDLVVAADGAHSVARQQLWPDVSLRHTGVTAWRWIVEGLSTDYAGMVWGPGGDVGIYPMPRNRTMVWAAGRPGVDDLDYYADWLDPVPELIAAADRIVRNDVVYLPVPRSLVRGRVALVGDAAHAMVPYNGQGTSVALEDAVTLAACAPNLAAYTAARRPRAQYMSLMARYGMPTPATSRAAVITAPMAGLLPNRSLRWAARAGVRATTTWTPPEIRPRVSPH
ncbi:FAD-dependent oxidoreductase [Nocardia sp. NPDC051832]|uniref:FAD-dependent oxidoreductase n=1 Tax=Nocardia sp. NPDC051832 TaxID=3155673 RepID=UPI0034369230